MKQAWESFKDNLRNKDIELYRSVVAKLNPGACVPRVESLEQCLGITLPGDYKACLLIHNGGCIDNFLWSGLDFNSIANVLNDHSIMEEVDHYLDSQQEDMKKLRFENGIKKMVFNPKWIPIASKIGHDDEVMIDLDPAPEGRIGQIILCKGNGNRIVIAPDFKTYFKQASREFIENLE